MKKLMILTLALVFILASCQEGTTVSNERSFLGGSDGITIDFQEGEPPAEVTDGDTADFTVTVIMQNRGETEVAAEDVTLRLKGVDASTFGVTQDSFTMLSPETLLKNDINPDTGEAINSPAVYATFGPLNYKGELSGNSDFPLRVEACYKYTTMATSRLCVKEDLFATDDEVCTVSGTKQIQNSGAPVQITSFEQFTAGQDAVSFSFNIRNVGGGILSELGSGCSKENVDENIVQVMVDTGVTDAGAELSCTGLTAPDATNAKKGVFSGAVKLSTGERSVRCTQKLPPKDQRTDKVMIVDLEIDYDYQVSKQTSILVKHI